MCVLEVGEISHRPKTLCVTSSPFHYYHPHRKGVHSPHYLKISSPSVQLRPSSSTHYRRQQLVQAQHKPLPYPDFFHDLPSGYFPSLAAHPPDTSRPPLRGQPTSSTSMRSCPFSNELPAIKRIFQQAAGHRRLSVV